MAHALLHVGGRATVGEQDAVETGADGSFSEEAAPLLVDLELRRHVLDVPGSREVVEVVAAWHGEPSTVADLLALRDWLEAHGITEVAMESTGVYWKPVFYALEDGMVLQRGPEDGHDAVAQLLVHGPLVPMQGLHHELENQIQDIASVFGIAVGEELHRALEVGGQDRDLLSVTLDRATASEPATGAGVQAWGRHASGSSRTIARSTCRGWLCPSPCSPMDGAPRAKGRADGARFGQRLSPSD